jgi:threonyl-tRNA synthetase
VFRHSSAHILGCSLENLFGVHLTHGPPLQSGFFYDCFMGKESIHPDDLSKIDEVANSIMK